MTSSVTLLTSVLMNLERSPQLFSAWDHVIEVFTDNSSEYQDYILFWEILILKNVEIEDSSSNYWWKGFNTVFSVA